MRLKKSVIWLIVVLVAGIYLFPAVKNRIAFAGSKPAANRTAPAFSLEGLNGQNVRLSDFKGRVVLVNFWASWCPPCRMEIPEFEKVYKAYMNKGFTIIGIATDNVPPLFIKQMGMTYPLAMADDQVISNYGNISGIPTSFLISRDGRIIKKVMGIYFGRDLRHDLQSALRKTT